MGTSIQWYADDLKTPEAFPECPWAVKFTEKTCRKLVRGDWDWETGMNHDPIKEIEYIRDYGLLVVYGNWSFLKNQSEKKIGFGSMGKWRREKRNHGDIPHLQSGGYVTKSGLAQIHAAEVVAPVEKLGNAVSKGMQPVSTKLDKLLTILKWSAIIKGAHSVYKFFKRNRYSGVLSKAKDAQVRLAEDFGTFFTLSMEKYDSIIQNLKGIYTGITGKITNVKNSSIAMYENAKDKAKSFYESKIKDKADSLLEKPKSIYNDKIKVEKPDLTDLVQTIGETLKEKLIQKL
jgi:hypothetical protein